MFPSLGRYIKYKKSLCLCSHLTNNADIINVHIK